MPTVSSEQTAGCLDTLTSPSCFGFLAFLGLLIGARTVHDPLTP